jgi:hypothetical protein
MMVAAMALGASACLPPVVRADDDPQCISSSGPAHHDCGTHNMMLVGTNSAFLSHLPMFNSEHRFQVILEATFDDRGEDVRRLYSEDRKAHPEIGMYTVNPLDVFVMSGLFLQGAHAPRTRFEGTVHRGHLERGSEEIDGLQGIDVDVVRVIYARELPTGGEKPDSLRYILFGDADELFLAHEITGAPDFDQIVAVAIDDRQLTADELQSGLVLGIPERMNAPGERLRKGESVEALLEAGSKPAETLHLRVLAEPYFEEGELLADPDFGPTPLEQEAGF